MRTTIISRDNRHGLACAGGWQNRVPQWRARLVGNCRASEAWSFAASGRYSGPQRNGYPNADIRPNTCLGCAPFRVLDARATG